MPSGASSQARGPDPAGGARRDGLGSPVKPRTEAPLKAARGDLHSRKPSPSPGRNPEDKAAHPRWAARPGREGPRGSPGLPPASEPPCAGGRAAAGPLARLGRRREARLPFSRFLDEVTVRVLDPGTLEAFRGPRGRSQEPSPADQGSGLAQEPPVGAATPEETHPALSARLSSEAAAEAARGGEPGGALETRGPCAAEGKRGGHATCPWRQLGQASAADMEKLSALQEQRGELRKRLSYTTHKLERLETEFDSTRHYLEIELRRAQEELEKVTEKLRRIQSNYMALQRINQELEDKLYRMGQHYEEEKRALSHEIVALNSHLLEAKVTIDKLSEDNLPSDFQERVSLHLEKHGCSLPAPLCHPAYADSVPTCVIAKVLEKPDPAALSSRLSDASARDLAFRDGAEKPGARPPYKGDIYCSDTALYCPEERRRDRRPSVDAPVTDVGFLRAQNSTDSAAEEEEEAEAAAFPPGFRREAFAGYAGSLPTSSSYSSFSATSEEKEHAQASTLTASQQAIYLNSRDELFDRKPPAAAAAAAYEGSPRFAKATAAVVAPLEAEVAPGFGRTVSPYPAEPFRFPASPGPQQALMPPNLWSLRAKPGAARLSGEDVRGQWRPLSVEDIGAYSYPAGTAGRASPCSFSERYYSGGGGGSPGKKAEGRASPLYASYKADSFSEGDDLSQGHLAEPCFLRPAGDLSLSPGRTADPLPGYAPSEGDGDRLGVQLCGAGSSPEPEPGSRDSVEPSSMEASPELHPAARLSPQQAFPRTGGSGLSRKDSLTKAQLYGTLLN
ncbi:brain-enriched guanylate kinase-associated protein isoform X2 [Oryctolagus cuniculus]|uniref:brain-enriched guanylate kinase-associated protein isoform X2 n=1 Tax=Oryctolagus cuniculus TaxID=9986 RepID=UPI003879FFF9